MYADPSEREAESLDARLARALDAGAFAEWSCELPSGRWLLATRLETVFGPGMPLDARAAEADARARAASDAERDGAPFANGSFADRLHPEDREVAVAAWLALLAGDECMVFETRITRTDGQPRRIRVEGQRVDAADGGVPRASGLVQDVTELSRLREINGFLSRLAVPLARVGDFDDTLQRIADDVVPFLADRCRIEFVEADGTLVRVADSHRPPGGPAPLPSEHPATHVPGAELIDRIIRERRTLVINDLDAAAIRDLSITEEQRLELEAYRPCDYLGAPLVAGGRCFGVLGILTQLDEKRRFAELELGLVERIAERMAAALDNARLYASLKESDERKDLFLATLSHELRNPVAAIAGGVEALRGAIVAEEDRHTLAVIDRQMQSLSHMLDDLLDVARVNEGKLELELGAVSLRSVLGDVLEALGPAFVARGQRLDATLPEPDIVLSADRTRLEQIVVNLLVNAGHYTPPGGTVSLRAWRVDERVCIEIADDGVGLSAAQCGRVFEQFVQFRPADGPKVGGLGLGLGLVRRLVVLHGGTVDVESEGLGRGSTFRVTLPLGAPLPAPAPAPTPSPGAPGRTEADAGTSLDILLVDDNVDAASVLARVLVRLGHSVRTAHDGAGALRAFEESRPALVLLDIGLPDLDGHVVAERMRRSDVRGNCFFAALTGYGHVSDRERALANGFDEHLVKPVRIALLEETVRRAIARARA